MRSFYKLTLSTLVAVYLLILVGGIVRSTGSGMGCPDWPKCFGNWIPPTSVDELPENYKQVYSEYRHKKNVRFAKYLTAFGFSETANRILSDQSIREEADFNLLKTWIEYVNRIVGVVIGLLIFAVFISSWSFRKTHPRITLLAFLSFVLVGFQGWIGSFVVSTNLTPWTITLHMFLALVLVGLLIYLLYIVTREESSPGPVDAMSTFTKSLLVVCMMVLLMQILLGTQVREAIDRVSAEVQNREHWIASLGGEFFMHRSFSWVVLLLNMLLVYKIWRMEPQKGFTLALILLILGTIFTGVGMAWFSVPPFLQPLHLLLATLTFGVEFLLLLQVPKMNKTVIINV